MSSIFLSRRNTLLGVGGLLLSGCDKITNNPILMHGIEQAEGLTRVAQRTLISRTALAKEFDRADISPVFKANGTTMPEDNAYQDHVAAGFANWRLRIDGLVRQPLDISLAQLRALPARTQITRHDCVEGWSAIGQWSGPQLGPLINRAGLLQGARYAVFHCADNLDGEASKGGEQSAGQYYESIDLVDVFHPQTILAHTLNGAQLSVAHGAPVRLRVERQLGYKQAKYIMRIELVQSFANLGSGKGGYWPDRGYEWFAGI